MRTHKAMFHPLSVNVTYTCPTCYRLHSASVPWSAWALYQDNATRPEFPACTFGRGPAEPNDWAEWYERTGS